MSQPTITKSVRSLEAELRVQLFGRSAGGIALTASGRAFFARARVAYSELRNAQDEAAELGGSSTGLVTFGVGPAINALIVPEAVLRFREEFPRARIRILEGLAQALLSGVRNGSLDFVMGLRPTAKLDSSLRFRPLYRSKLLVVARKSHPLRHTRSLAQLATADWLTTSTLAATGGPVERLFSSAGLPPPRPLIQCESYNTIVALLTQSDMLGLMQRRALGKPYGRDVLQEIPIQDTMPSVTAGIFMRADTPLTRVAAAMAKAATAVAQRLARTE